MNMTENELQDRRRARLIAWVDSHGGATAVRKAHGLPTTFDTQLSQFRSGYSLGPRAARKLEAALGLAEGYLDGDDAPKAQQELGKEHSPMAMLLADTFDMLPDNHLTRVTVFQEACQLIIGRLSPDKRTQPTDALARSGQAKTQP